MKSLYLDCSMGAAGDMLTAALLELFPDKEKIVDELNAIGVPGVRFEMEKSVNCGIAGTHMRVLWRWPASSRRCNPSAAELTEHGSRSWACRARISLPAATISTENLNLYPWKAWKRRSR